MLIRELVTRLAFSADMGGADRYDARLKKTEGVAKQTLAAFRKLSVGIAVYNEIADSIGQAAQRIAAAVLLVPRAGVEMQRSIQAINGELQDTALATETYEKLYQAVRTTGASVDETSRAFGRYQGAMADNGRGVDETITLITGLQAAMTSAGMSAAEMNSVTTQLGQALGSGTLSGDEFKSLRENLPNLVRHLRTELGMTGAEIKKAAEDQKLTTDKLIGPLLSYARKAREELAAAPPDMLRSWANLATTFNRLIADLDKTFRLSERIARALDAVSRALERWRQYIPMLGAMIDRMGGLQSSLTALGIVLGGYAAYAVGVQRLAAAFVFLSRATLAFLAPLAGIAAWFLVIEDFVSWMQGKDSLFGDRFGDFSGVRDRVVAQFQEIKAAALAAFGLEGVALPDMGAAFAGLRDAALAAFAAVREAAPGAFAAARDAALPVLAAVGSAAAAAFGGMSADGEAMGAALVRSVRWVQENWDALRQGFADNAIGGALRGMAADGEALRTAFLAVSNAVVANWPAIQAQVAAIRAGVADVAALVRDALLGAFNAVTGAISAMWDKARAAFEWLRSNLPSVRPGEGVRGAAPLGDPATGFQLQNFAPAVPPGALVGPRPVNAPQSNTINMGGVHVTAGGNTGAEVAAGAQKGAAAALRGAFDGFGGMARSLGMANPRAEVAAA